MESNSWASGRSPEENLAELRALLIASPVRYGIFILPGGAVYWHYDPERAYGPTEIVIHLN